MVFEMCLPCDCFVGAWLPEDRYPDFNRPGMKVFRFRTGPDGPATDGDSDFVLTKALHGLMPPDGATVETLTPELSWKAFPASTRYAVDCAIAGPRREAQPAWMRGEVTGTTFTMPKPLAPGDRAMWTVVAFEGGVPIAAGSAEFAVASEGLGPSPEWRRSEPSPQWQRVADGRPGSLTCPPNGR